MNTFTAKKLLLVIGAVASGLACGTLAQADPLVVPAGFDLFETVPGSPPDMGTWFDAPSLPPGFFGMKGGIPSDPTPPGRVFFMGLPTGPLGNPPSAFQPDPFPEDDPIAAARHFVMPAANLANTDTIVQRRADAIFPNLGDSAQVPIEIISLSLVSVNPIPVTYGGSNPSFFDVFVDLAPGPQGIGFMQLMRTSAFGGTFDSQLPVNARLTFGGSSPTDPIPSEIPQLPKVFQSEGVPWLIPEPATCALMVSAVLGLLAVVRWPGRRLNILVPMNYRPLPWMLLSGTVMIWLATCDLACGQTATVKVNWDVGTADGPFQGFNLSYHDAHLKIATRGIIENMPAPTTIDDGFANHMVNVTPGFPDDCITIDWTNPGPLMGQNHIGAEFNVTRTPVTGNRNDVRVVESRLTMVSGMSPTGGSFGPVPSLDVPGPQSITYRRANSAEVSISVDNPAMITPVMFSGVEFYKTATEPALADLDAADFPALPKTFLLAVPDFTLSFGGSIDLIVPGVDVPEWLLVKYTTTWMDPTLTSLLSEPTSVTVNTWFAGEMIPEPAALILALVGLLALVVFRR